MHLHGIHIYFQVHAVYYTVFHLGFWVWVGATIRVWRYVPHEIFGIFKSTEIDTYAICEVKSHLQLGWSWECLGEKQLPPPGLHPSPPQPPLDIQPCHTVQINATIIFKFSVGVVHGNLLQALLELFVAPVCKVGRHSTRAISLIQASTCQLVLQPDLFL